MPQIKAVNKGCTVILCADAETDRYTVSIRKGGNSLFKTDMDLDTIKIMGIYKQLLKAGTKKLNQKGI